MPLPWSRRRWLALLALALLGLGAAGRAAAGAECDAGTEGGWRTCRAALPEAVVQRMVQSQERTRWCWAAAISMVFARHGHVVPQQAIVERIYGAPANVGLPTQQLPAVIDRDWWSEGGVLRASTQHQTAPAGHTLPASALLLVSSLAREQPLILSTEGHAVVVVGVSYLVRGPWLRITGGTVLDPRPGVGERPLRTSELEVALLASVDVVPVPEPPAVTVARGDAAEPAR
jgi:hypothetical protein